MWQNNEESRGPDSKHNAAARPAAGDDIFGMLTELNERCLGLLTEQALRPLASAPMFRELPDSWRQLDPAARRRAAACPYLLMDAGFSDPYRWQRLSDQHASTRAGVADTQRAPLILDKQFFTAPSLQQVARSVFTGAWHIAQTHPLEATLFLGMPAYCVALLRTCSILQLADLAEQHTSWLKPRWSGRPKVWRQLLEAALCGDSDKLQMARLRGVQLLAMEVKMYERSKNWESTR